MDLKVNGLYQEAGSFHFVKTKYDSVKSSNLYENIEDYGISEEVYNNYRNKTMQYALGDYIDSDDEHQEYLAIGDTRFCLAKEGSKLANAMKNTSYTRLKINYNGTNWYTVPSDSNVLNSFPDTIILGFSVTGSDDTSTSSRQILLDFILNMSHSRIKTITVSFYKQSVSTTNLIKQANAYFDFNRPLTKVTFSYDYDTTINKLIARVSYNGIIRSGVYKIDDLSVGTKFNMILQNGT